MFVLDWGQKALTIMNTPIPRRHDKPFSVTLFVITIVSTLIVCAFLMKFFVPSVWQTSLDAPLWRLAVVFLVAHLGTAFAEHYFHRYFLHSPFPFLRRLYRQHTLHHGLTNMKLISVTDAEGKVFNRYPILSTEQHEASYFPWYSLAVFITVAMPVIIPLQLVLPEWPVTVGSVLAIAWAISLYEIIHMAEHLSFETFWKPKVMHPTFGKWWTSFYCFHLRHHAEVKLNENISGFFGIPIADLTLGTYAPWPRVYLHGERVPRSEFEAHAPRPRLIVRITDAMLLRD